MAHRDRHPVYDPTCFGCKVASIGWQGKQSAAGGRKSDPVEKVPVVADEGTRAGKTVGRHEVHWDGRQDAVVRPATHVLKATTEERE